MKYIDTCDTVGDRKGVHCDIGYIISKNEKKIVDQFFSGMPGKQECFWSLKWPFLIIETVRRYLIRTI